MSCYFRHIKDIFEDAGISVSVDNKKMIDQAIHNIVGTGYKDCSTTWKTLKRDYLSDDSKRKDLVNKLSKLK